MQWTALDAQLAAHACADEKEARDVAFVRAFLRAHPADAHLRSQPGKLRRWLQPGGHGEGETDPRQIALREIAEETGLSPADLKPFPDEKLLDVDVHPIPARKDEPAHPHLDLRYGFLARVGAEPRLSHESRDLRWFTLDQLPGGVDASLRRAIRKLGGGTRYR